MSDAGFGLVVRLLSKGVGERLGSQVNDGQTIRKAKFFEGIDWKMVSGRGLESKLKLVLDNQLVKKEAKLRMDLEGRSDMSSDLAGMTGRDEDVEEDCSKGSMWLDGFTEGQLTQSGTGC